MKDTCLQILNRAVEQFRSAGVDRPRTNAEFLLGAVLNAKKIDLYLDHDRILSPEQVEKFNQFSQERISGKPLQYIIGNTEFFGLEFKVNESVLIPRPETETLVEVVLEHLRDMPLPRIIDLGTGSGAIAVALAKNLKDCVIFATDISPDALDVAKENAKRHGVGGKIEFLCGDLFEPLRESSLQDSVDCVVSNPPYVSPKEFDNLPQEIKEHEPIVALKADQDGTFFHKKIIKAALHYLKAGGILAMEVGWDQANEVADLLRNWEGFKGTEIKKDLGGIERIVIASKA
jgi:release factor glutamine methyltransferase